jgi:hypothetical protein
MPRETAFIFVEAAGFSCDEPPLNPLQDDQRQNFKAHLLKAPLLYPQRYAGFGTG